MKTNVSQKTCLMLLLLWMLLVSCDKGGIIHLNGDKEKVISTPCGTVTLNLTHLWSASFNLHCEINVPSLTGISADKLKIVVNNKEISYSLRQDDKLVKPGKFSTKDKIVLDYSFEVPPDWGPKLAIEILAVGFFHPQTTEDTCGIPSFVVMFNR